MLKLSGCDVRPVTFIILRLHFLCVFASAFAKMSSVSARHVNGHMAVHAATSGHVIAASFIDLSFWCYSCDSYLDFFKIPCLLPYYSRCGVTHVVCAFYYF